MLRKEKDGFAYALGLDGSGNPPAEAISGFHPGGNGSNGVLPDVSGKGERAALLNLLTLGAAGRGPTA